MADEVVGVYNREVLQAEEDIKKLHRKIVQLQNSEGHSQKSEQPKHSETEVVTDPVASPSSVVQPEQKAPASTEAAPTTSDQKSKSSVQEPPK